MAFVSALGMALITVPAQAAPGDAVAKGNAGTVTIGQTTIPPIAPCTTEGSMKATSSGVSVPKVATFSSSRSACTIDDAGEVATVTVTSGRFRFDTLRQYGGPRIRLASYTIKCQTSLLGSKASAKLTGLSGVKVPTPIPRNHLVTIPGSNGKPKATITFNETITTTPPDGSMTVHLMHIRMFPQGGPISGDAYIGTVHCASVN